MMLATRCGILMIETIGQNYRTQLQEKEERTFRAGHRCSYTIAPGVTRDLTISKWQERLQGELMVNHSEVSNVESQSKSNRMQHAPCQELGKEESIFPMSDQNPIVWMAIWSTFQSHPGLYGQSFRGR
jgi:hypothetical protein